MKYFSSIIAVLIIGSTFGQGSQDTFIFIQDHLHVDHNYVLTKEDYAKFKDEISIDTASNDRRGQYKVWLISDNFTKVEHYSLPDSSGLNLGRAQALLKRMEFSTGISAEYHFAALIADSLRNQETYFFTYPELSTKLRHELVVVAWLDYPDSLNNLEYNEKRDAIYPYYNEFSEKFHQDFSEYGEENIHIFSMMAGHVRIVIHLESNSFPIQKLADYNLNFIHKPKVKPRIFEFSILEE